MRSGASNTSFVLSQQRKQPPPLRKTVDMLEGWDFPPPTPVIPSLLAGVQPDMTSPMRSFEMKNHFLVSDVSLGADASQ